MYGHKRNPLHHQLRGWELRARRVIESFIAEIRNENTRKGYARAVGAFFDWLVTGQVLGANPAAPVRPPKLVVRGGKTSILTAGETRELFDSIVAKVPLRAS